MKRFLLLLLVLINLTIHLLFAQSLSWTQKINNGGIYPFCIDKTNSVYITGSFTGTIDLDQGPNVYNITALGIDDWFLLKEDANGNFMWAKHFDGSQNSNAFLANHASSIDSNGNIFIHGGFVGSFDFDPGTGTFNMTTPSSPTINYINTYLLKLDSTGNFIWAKQFTGSNGGIGDRDMKLDSDGNIYLLSAFGGTIDVDPGPNVVNMTSVSTNAMLIEKLDNNGNYQWAKQVGAVGGMSLAIDSSHNLYIAGAFQNTADFDPSSNVVNLTAIGSEDIFIEKFDSVGNFLWVKQVSGGGSNIPQGITIDKYRNLFVTGYFEGTVDFDPSASVNNLTSNGIRDAFILKLNQNGVYKWAHNMGGGTYDDGRAVTVDSNCSVYTVGEFQGSADFNPGSGNYFLNSQGDFDVFTQKLDSSGNFMWAIEVGSTGTDIPVAINLDHSNNVFFNGGIGAGGAGGTGDFDPGPGVFTMGGVNAGFIEKLCNSNPLQINTNSTVFCEGDTVSLYTPPLPNTSFQWVKDGTVIPSVTGDTLKVYQTGSYSVSVPGNSCSQSTIFYMQALPMGHPTISILAPTTVPFGQQATVTVNLTGITGAYLIHWFVNGQMFTTNNSATFSYTKTWGIDTVFASILAQAPCNDTSLSATAFIMATEGITSIPSQPQFLIFPNPTKDQITIQYSQAGSFVLTDIAGRVLLQASTPLNYQKAIDISMLAKGVYLLRFSSNEGAVETVKVVKE